MKKTGINFQRCNVGSAEQHNRRDKAYIAAVNASPKKHYSIFEERTPENTRWENPAYGGRNLLEILAELKKNYIEKVGQAPQEKDRVREITDKKTGMKKTVVNAGWSPIREGVCPVEENTTLEEFTPFINWLVSKGITPISISIHRDEGHRDPISGQSHYNLHAHIIVDWTDHSTGKTVKLNRIDAAEMQTQIALSLRMERGLKKEITGADHKSHDQYRAEKELEEGREIFKRVENLKATKIGLEEDVSRLDKQKSIISEDINSAIEKSKFRRIREDVSDKKNKSRAIIAEFDYLGNSGIVRPTESERRHRDFLEKECNSPEPSDATGLSHLLVRIDMFFEATCNAVIRMYNSVKNAVAKVGLIDRTKLEDALIIEALRGEVKKSREESSLKTKELDAANTALVEKDKARERERRGYDESRRNYEERIKAVESESETKVAKLQRQIISQNLTLIRTFGSETFEKKGLPFTKLNSWNIAKSAYMEEQRKQEPSGANKITTSR